MENSGYKVIDLGKDVSPDAFVKAAIEYKADLAGLCSLMTTTLPELESTVKKLKEAVLCRYSCRRSRSNTGLCQ